MMNNRKDFGYLGETYQLKIFNQIVIDKPFASSVINILDEKYFSNKYFKLLLELIKEYHIKYETTPNFNTLNNLIKTEIDDTLVQNILSDTIFRVREVETDDYKYVQDIVTNFCKQQALQDAIVKAQKIIDDGDFISYETVSGIIQDALKVGDREHGAVDAISNLDSVLEDEFRYPIPTGVDGLDELLGGGLGRGELGLIIAPMGVGKTTFTTIVANKAFERGHNVLQIIFEDNVTAIQRKHITIWTGISPSEFKDRKDEVKHLVERVNSNHKNKLLIQKLPSDGVNILQIGNIIKKIIADGVILDLVVLDYIDCVLPHRSSGNEWKDEASTMRKFEAMCSEFDIAGWVATQGSRDSISADVVTNDKVGGSVKKIAIAHVIITVAKTLYQKENKLATMAITKSRLGPDGIIFENCLYDNEMLKISTATNTTFLGHKENKEEAKANRVKELLAKANSTDDETYLG